MDIHQTAGERRRRTAAVAVVAAFPGLALTTLAALGANALSLRADLVLTALDMVVLLVAFAVARRRRLDDEEGAWRWEAGMSTLVALCMVLSMSVVGWAACMRIVYGDPAPVGPGIALGLAVNGIYAAVNFSILVRWRRQHRHDPSSFTRSQLCLFCDKLSTNLLITVSLGVTYMFCDAGFVRYVDPVASLLIVAASARWVAPVLQDVLGSFRTKASACGRP